MSTYCSFAPGHPLHGPYHDREYGFPLADDDALFERFLLEINQAGLSWELMLKRRESFRRAYDGFAITAVAGYGKRDVARLLADPGIIRNRLKVEASIRNARAFLELQREFGSFNDYVWRFVDGRPKLNRWRTLRQLPAKTAESDALSKDLISRGFSFVGSTIIYAHMQAVGMVNDHLVHCFRYRALTRSS